MPQYCTKSVAQLYFQGKLRTESWDSASDIDRDKALNEATTLIDNLNFAGSVTVPGQLNQFPRSGDTMIPQAIINATCEIALKLLDGFDPDLESKNILISETRFGITTSRRATDQNVPPYILAGIPSPTAWNFLLPFLRDPMELTLTRVN